MEAVTQNQAALDPCLREGRQPAAHEEQCRERRDQDHVRVFGKEEDREGHPGILHMETGHDLGLAFGHVEGRAVGLGDTRDQIDAEQGQQWQPEPGQDIPFLGRDDRTQIQASSRHQHTDQRKAHRDLVGDDLGRRAHGAEQRIFRVGRPTRDDDAVDTKRGQRKQIEQAGIDVGQHQPFVEGEHRPGGQGRCDRDHGRQQE